MYLQGLADSFHHHLLINIDGIWILDNSGISFRDISSIHEVSQSVKMLRDTVFYDRHALQKVNLQLLYPLLYLFPNGLICIHDRLLIDYDLRCVRLRSANS